jgi:hypothetical protein
MDLRQDTITGAAALNYNQSCAGSPARLILNPDGVACAAAPDHDYDARAAERAAKTKFSPITIQKVTKDWHVHGTAATNEKLGDGESPARPSITGHLGIHLIGYAKNSAQSE